jgi:hypothetical protein
VTGVPEQRMIKTRDDLEGLIINKVPEGKALEFKRELPGPSDKGNVKILQSITSFANTNGGELLYGVDARDGIPVGLPGIDGPSADAIQLRIENLCKDGVQERLPHLSFTFIPVDNDKTVLVIRIPKSWASPHRVTTGGHAHFYGRKTGSYRMDVSELRSAFSLSQSIADKAREFRSGRLQRILANDTPVPVSSAGKLVLHVIAASAFDPSTGVGVVPSKEQRSKFAPIGWVQNSEHLNFDGYVSYTSFNTPNVSYTQQFRSGIIESLLAFEELHDGGHFLMPHWYEIRLIKAVENHISALEQLGSSSPFFVFLSFLGIAQYQLIINIRGGGGFDYARRKLDRDTLILPTVAIEDSKQIGSGMRALFDMVWNAFGLERSRYFNDESEWIGPLLS